VSGDEIEPMVTDSISSSISAAQEPIGSAMTSNVTPNSPDSVDTALKAPAFADVLLSSLSRAIPSGEVRSDAGISSGLVLNSEKGARQLGNITDDSLGQIQEPYAAGTEAILPSKKPVKQPANVSAHSGAMDLTVRESRSSDSSNALQQPFVNHSAFLNPVRSSGNLLVYNPNSEMLSSEPVQTVQGSAEDDLDTDHTVETIPARNGNAEALPFSHAETVAVDSSAVAQQSLPVISEHGRISAEIESFPAAPTDLSESNSTKRPVAMTATARGPQVAALPAPPLGQNTSPVLQRESSVQGMSHPIIEGTDSAQSRSVISPESSPLMYRATPNLQPVVKNFEPTDAISSEASNGTSVNASPFVATVGTAGSVPPQALPHPFGQVTNPSLPDESPLQAITGPVLDGTAKAQSQSAASPAASPAMSSIPPIVGYSAPTGTVSSNDSNSNWIGASKESSNGTFGQDPNSTETDVATPPAPSAPEASLGGTTFMARQSVQAPDPTSSISITAIRVESEAVAEVPITPSPNVEASKSIKRTSLAGLLDPIETKDPNPKTDPMPSRTDDKSRKDAGKNPPNLASNSASDGGAGRPATALPETANAKAPKMASLVDLLDSAAIKDPNPKTDRAPLSTEEQSRRDTGKFLDIPAVGFATDREAGSPAIPLSGAVNGEPPEIASLPAALDSAAIDDPNSKTDDAPSSADDSSRKDSGKNLANRSSIAATDSGAASPQNSPSDAVNSEALKLGMTDAANATQAAGADASSLTAGKPLAGDVKAPLHGADPSVKDGNQGAGVESSSGGQQAASIQSAQITSQIGKSGVRIALQGEQFGAVELHARVTGDQVSASITADHRETHALLSSDLPALQQMLNERQLRVSEIILLHNSLGSSTSSDGGPAAKRQAATPQQANTSFGNGGAGSPLTASASSGQTCEDTIFDSRGRLSVRA
jgi:hypothetical protein